MTGPAATEPSWRGKRRLYRPVGKPVLRAPLLPIERYEALSAPTRAGHRTTLLTHVDVTVRHALTVASPSVAAAVDRAVAAESVDARLSSTLLSYLIRMSTRPTPYGVFAGVALAEWSSHTDLALDAAPRRTRTRPDMGWLLPLALGQEADESVRHHTGLVMNTCAFERDGRIHVTEPVTPHRGLPGDVSVRASPVVRRALALARGPVPYRQFCAALLAATPDATAAQVQALLDDLWRQDLLLSDLRPPLTGDPARYFAERLSGTGAGPASADRLRRLLASARLVDDAAGSAAGTVLLDVARRARTLAGADRTELLQVDSALPLQGNHLSTTVADDAALAAELLLRLHPAPGGSPALSAYRHAFLARYGHERMVTLPELLDPRFGLGPLSGHGPAGHGGQHAAGTAHGARRQERLLDLAAEALQEDRLEVNLNRDDLAELALWEPDPTRVPASLELSAVVLARDRAAVDRRDYRLMVAPGLGSGAAGRSLGRFADLLGEPAVQALKEMARAEEAHHPHAVHAELVYLPTDPRSANVAIRPVVRDYEIPVGVTPGVPLDRVIPASELAVGVRDGRLRLWWARHGTEVRVAAGHMLNTRGAPEICRFLDEVGRDGVTDLHEFDWGDAAVLPRLPRVVHGRIVLSPAQWVLRGGTIRRLLDGTAAGFPDRLAAWRERWRTPRRLYLTEGDNRLLLDLDEPCQTEILRRALNRGRGRSALLQETLPAPEHAWLPGPGGRYLSEVVVPLSRTPSAPPQPPWAPALSPEIGEDQRRRAPGSDWLYLKLYGPAARQDHLVSGPLLRFAEALTRTGCLSGWFFLRYADPAEHLRLRLHGDPAVLVMEVLPAAARWASELLTRGECTEWSTDVYERELERYGGPAGTTAAESVFAADSTAVAQLLAMRTDAAIDPVELAVLTVDDLVGALRLDEGELTQVFSDRWLTPEAGREYRRRKERLQELLAAGPQGIGPAATGVAVILAQRRAAVAEPAARLRFLADRGALSVPIADIAASLVHLHLNRLSAGSEERMVMDLVRRTHRARRTASRTPPE
ncbi:lantibiotic dehydratase [Geodermatophilus sp. SYSU D00814]